MFKIELEKQIINNDYIEITGSSTSWCNHSRIKKLDLKELLAKYSKIVKLAKESGCSIVYSNHYKKTLTQLKEKYINDMEVYNNTFDKLVILWNNKVNKGLYAPASDDLELKEITELDFILQRMNYRNCSISIFNNINHQLEDLLSRLSAPDFSKMVKIFL